MRVVHYAVSVAVVAAGIAACGQGADAPSGLAAESCPSGPLFSVSPVAFVDIEGITVVGGLSAPGHTLPTAQAGFYLATEGATVRSPARIQINELRRATYTVSPVRQGKQDYAVDFQVCKDIKGWFGHLTTLSAAIPPTAQWQDCRSYSTSTETVEACVSRPSGLSIDAGQELGTGGLSKALGLMGLDFGLLDARADNGFVADWRYPPASKQAICPWDKFEPGIANALFAKLFDPGWPSSVPLGDPRCGTMKVDVAGTAQGVWALPSATTAVAGSEVEYITLANYPYQPQYRLALSLGPPSLGATTALVPRGSALVNRVFSEVTNDGLVYCYGPDLARPGRSWLIQLVSPTSLRIRMVELPAGNTCSQAPGTWSMVGAIAMNR